MHGAIDTELQDRDLRAVTSEPADLLVHYHAAVIDRVEVPSPVGQLRDCVGERCRSEVTGYEAGTLVIDVVEASTQRVIWRGWAEHRLEDMLDDPPLVRRRVRDAVHRIVERLPLTSVGRPSGAVPEVTP